MSLHGSRRGGGFGDQDGFEVLESGNGEREKRGNIFPGDRKMNGGGGMFKRKSGTWMVAGEITTECEGLDTSRRRMYNCGGGGSKLGPNFHIQRRGLCLSRLSHHTPRVQRGLFRAQQRSVC